MIAKGSIEELAAILEKSRDQMEFRNPSIQMVTVGQYRVAGQHQVYDVVCGRTETNEFFVACLCKASLFRGVCYHGLKAFELWYSQITNKEQI